MVNNNSNLLTVVWVAIAVAIVASIATASITGDTIKVINSKFARNEVYTKAEVDAKINPGVFNLLSNCAQIDGSAFSKNLMVDNCTRICKEHTFSYGKNCIFGMIQYSGGDNSLVSCNGQGAHPGLASTQQLSCMCC